MARGVIFCSMPSFICDVLEDVEMVMTYTYSYGIFWGFSAQVVVPNPDIRGRQEILELYLEGKPRSPDIDVKVLARGTPGFSGAGEVPFTSLRGFRAVRRLLAEERGW